MRDGQLRFRWAHVQRELRETERLVSPFLDRGALGRLATAADHLEVMRQARRGGAWGLASEAPVVTRPSRAYEVEGRKGAHEVQARIDSTWSITAEDAQVFRVTGNVSTRIRLVDAADGCELGRWRVELGAEGAPGCFFHTQIRGQEEDEEPPWPHSLPVPRLPTPLISIPAVVVFVLGELFQTEWDRHVDDARSQRLAADQRRDLERRLQWELSVVRSDGTLPYSSLKNALPHRDLFLPDPKPEVFADG
jgi:hypothetical protein